MTGFFPGRKPGGYFKLSRPQVEGSINVRFLALETMLCWTFSDSLSLSENEMAKPRVMPLEGLTPSTDQGIEASMRVTPSPRTEAMTTLDFVPARLLGYQR